jgi:hypothetical protein
MTSGMPKSMPTPRLDGLLPLYTSVRCSKILERSVLPMRLRNHGVSHAVQISDNDARKSSVTPQLADLSYVLGSGPGGRWFESTRPDHLSLPSL